MFKSSITTLVNNLGLSQNNNEKKEITLSGLRNEFLAGITVSLALVPEAVAFAFVAGVAPLVGLYAAFIVGLITALFGGRPGMISGATGALAVVMVFAAFFLPIFSMLQYSTYRFSFSIATHSSLCSLFCFSFSMYGLHLTMTFTLSAPLFLSASTFFCCNVVDFILMYYNIIAE